MTRKGALNVLTEVVERTSGGAGTGIRPKPLSDVKRREVSAALRRMARMIYGEDGMEYSYPVMVASEIDLNNSEGESENSN